MNVLPITREGGILAKLRHLFGNEAQLQEGDVRVIKELKANDVSQRFNLNGEGGTKLPGEVFIGLNDLVVPYALKVFVNKILDTTSPGNIGNTDDLTYPDLSIFTGAAVAGVSVSEADALKALWSGDISMKANTIEVLNKMVLKRFYISNQTQGSATTQPQILENGFQPIIQPAIFSGRDTNVLEFNPLAGADLQAIGGIAGTSNFFGLHFKVIVVRNGAQPATWTQVSQMLDSKTANRVLV
jgi:hypothetical protein